MTTNRHLRRAAAFAAASLMLAGLAVPAAATDTAPRQDRDRQQQTTRTNVDDHSRICVRTRLSGSNLLRRICKTAAEWEAEGGLPTER